MKMWSVENEDNHGEGLCVVWARDEHEAKLKAQSMEPAATITSVEHIIAISLATVTGERGELLYVKRSVTKG